jgi:hypothetical protein
MENRNVLLLIEVTSIRCGFTKTPLEEAKVVDKYGLRDDTVVS